MQKSIVLFECQSCGASFPKWQGKCDNCKSWNSLIEIKQVKEKSNKPNFNQTKTSVPLHSVKQEDSFCYQTNVSEFDRVLGNGLVKGSVVLLGGEPGIGKSTLSLQVCLECAQKKLNVLYISAEESESQIKNRASRIGGISDSLWVLSQTNMLAIMQECERLNPDIILLDSIQVVYHPELSSVEGTVSQVRHCASNLISWIKANHKSAILIGHITKDGQIAGPKVLEHLVDVILYLEGDSNFNYRLLRCQKNRYASTDHIGLFEMKKAGLLELSDPSQLFIASQDTSSPGSVIFPYLQGSRVILVEIQALVVQSNFGNAKRNFVGVNPNRANLLIAALDKLLKLKLGAHDIFLTVIGGVTISDPAADLAMIVAIISSLKQQVIPLYTGICGEVSLTGEVRPASYIEKRVLELEKNGFKQVIIPKKNKLIQKNENKLKIIQASYIIDIITLLFNNSSKYNEK